MNEIKMAVAIVLLAVVVLPTQAHADNSELAMNLGSVLGAEQGCGLSYDQIAIQRFIQRNVPASDMDFSSTVEMSASNTASELQAMADSRRTAFCTQTAAVAAHYGFLQQSNTGGRQ